MLNPTRKNYALSVLAIAFFVIIALASGDDKKTSSSSGSASAEDVKKPAENWSYESDTDKMTSKVVYYGSTDAKEPVKLKFPYEGSEASLVIARKNNQSLAYFKVTKGQILAANPVNGGEIKVRFDSDQPETYQVSGPSDMSSETVFINSADRFITRLKKSKTLLVEVEFFDNGTRQVEFNTSNFVWNH
ncbi:MAG: hypothetical protein JWO03_1165 [Bacteroidetes bacterium]|nr:hypothetical protein [Bacteroidota bacterium]